MGIGAGAGGGAVALLLILAVVIAIIFYRLVNTVLTHCLTLSNKIDPATA